MKAIFRNTGYFIKEVKTIIKLDLLSNLFSIVSLAFIFFMVSMVMSGGLISNEMISSIKNEAEISIYYYEDLSTSEISSIVGKIKVVNGVQEVSLINKDEAQDKMKNILGQESRIIELFDHNPFSPYIEVKIDLNNIDSILREVKNINGVEYVRDNKDILDRMISLSKIFSLLGILVIAAVSISTFVITSHIIRQGIYNNREQINTLRLLGAPEGFITLPFVLEGLLLTIIAGVLAVIMGSFTLKYVYSQIADSLPFLVFSSIDTLVKSIGIITLGLSVLLGAVGSFFGLKSTNK